MRGRLISCVNMFFPTLSLSLFRCRRPREVRRNGKRHPRGESERDFGIEEEEEDKEFPLRPFNSISLARSLSLLNSSDHYEKNFGLLPPVNQGCYLREKPKLEIRVPHIQQARRFPEFAMHNRRGIELSSVPPCKRARTRRPILRTVRPLSSLADPL